MKTARVNDKNGYNKLIKKKGKQTTTIESK